jgi:hypothetical protein
MYTFMTQADAAAESYTGGQGCRKSGMQEEWDA